MQTPIDLQPAVIKPDPFAVGAQFDHMTEPRIATIIGVTSASVVLYDCREFDDINERWVCIQKNFARPAAAFLGDYMPTMPQEVA